MLTGNLLRARVDGELLRPSFLDPSSRRHRETAELLLSMGRRASEEALTRGQLQEIIEDEVVGNRMDHRLLRGMARVLQDRCRFETSAPLPPPELRARLFARGPARRRPGPGTGLTAADHMARLAEELGCTEEEVSRGLFADLKENQTTVACDVASAEWLLNRYNVALVEGLLIHALEVVVTLRDPKPERARQLFRLVKFHQLMHRIKPLPDGGFQVLLDGPASLLKLSTRYGLRLARLFPALPLQEGQWTMEARLKWMRRHRRLEVTSDDALVSHLQDKGSWVSREEQWLEERFATVDTPWRLSRGGPVLDLGGEAVWVPDFTLRCGERVAFLEVVGIWRKAWLQSRLDLLRRHGAENAILAVNRRLLGEGGAMPAMPGPVVPFSQAVPVREVLKAAESCACSMPQLEDE